MATVSFTCLRTGVTVNPRRRSLEDSKINHLMVVQAWLKANLIELDRYDHMHRQALPRSANDTSTYFDRYLANQDRLSTPLPAPPSPPASIDLTLLE